MKNTLNFTEKSEINIRTPPELKNFHLMLDQEFKTTLRLKDVQSNRILSFPTLQGTVG